jgi:hypothetical protein
MSYLNEKLAGEPIIISTLHKDFDFATEAEPSAIENLALLNAATQPLYFIADLRAVHFDLGELIAGADLAAGGENPMLHHPNVKEALFVITDKIMEIAAENLGSQAFGRVKVKLFDNLEDALAYARSQ